MGGAERLVIDICNELSTRDNISVALVVMNNINDFDGPILFPIIQTDSRVTLSIVTKNNYDLNSLNNLLADFKPDVIHSHLLEAEILSRAVIKQDVRYFSHFHDNISQLKKNKLWKFSSKKEIANLVERNWLLKRYKKSKTNFIAISKDTADYIDTHIPKHRDLKVCFLHNAINISNFQLPKIEKQITNSSKITLLSIGSLVTKKNQLFQIEIVHELLLRGLDVELQICGEGYARERVEQKIKEYKLDKSIHILGNVKNVQDKLMQADLLIHTATYEPFGLVFLEAMAAKVPIVTLNGKGNTDIILHKYNALLVEHEDVTQFCDAIELIVSDTSLRNTITMQGAEFVKKYDIVLYVDQLLKLYASK
jgi:glycosyltransferase involved in cell wall biosynthesis